MTDKIAEPIEFILKSELGGILSKAFADLYRTKPNFPVTYLANWLKQQSQNRQSKVERNEHLKQKIQQFHKLQEQQKKRAQHASSVKTLQQQKSSKEQQIFNQTISSIQHLEDLLVNWLPEYIQKRYNLSGAYVGNLNYRHKPVEPNNFELGAELDTQNAKIIQYIGTSNSQKNTMHMKVLPNQQGVSFECFNQPEPQPEEAQPAEGQQAAPKKESKKTYIYVPDVTKNQKMYFFKFPKLGSYACFPLKLKSVLTQAAFDQGVIDYKQFIKQKQQSEKQYHERLNQLRNQFEQAKKKHDQFQIPEQDPSPQQQAEKTALQEEVRKLETAFTQLQNNPPKIPQPNYLAAQKNYCLGCDTMGRDEKIKPEILQQIDIKMSNFKRIFEEKQKSMLLHDILAYNQQQPKLQAIQNIYRDYEKNANNQSEQQAKEKGLKDKQLQFEIAATKAKKINAIFEDPNIERSMKSYFSYNVPKYKKILQIALMLLGYKSEEINLERKNELNWRKVKSSSFIQQFMKKLQTYELKPKQAPACKQQYKINKLLERLQAIDLEQVAKYNGFIWVLANQLKLYCWALILCRDAKKQAYEQSVKAKEDRDAERQKYKEEREKAMNAVKGELEPEAQQAFNEQEWIGTYCVENPQPQPLQAIKLQQYLNID